MSRLDVPTLMCDRCQTVTQDLQEMARFRELRSPTMSGDEKWDLCPSCWGSLRIFLRLDEEKT